MLNGNVVNPNVNSKSGQNLALTQNTYTYVGSFNVADGPCYLTAPTTYSAVEAAALIFGGASSDYAISVNSNTTDQTTITHTAYIDGYANDQYFNTPASETAKQGNTYVSKSFSAYVKDHSDGNNLGCGYSVGIVKTNYVWRVGSVSTSPPTANAQSFCQGATVSNLVASGTTLQWFTTLTSGSALDNSIVLATGTYYVSQTLNGIESIRTSVQVTVNSNITPIFTTIAPICSGASLSALPTTSINGITGIWSPALNNTTTTTYTFTPDTVQCATSTTLDITVNPNITPTFTTVSPICSGASLLALPTTSINGITGIWSPALNNTTTTTYTFTPDTGQCATSTTLDITVNPNITPTFSAVSPICSGASLLALPTTSINGITGIWSPALNNTTTTTYTFTPDAGQCATTTILIITVNPIITPTFAAVAPIAPGTNLLALPTTSNNGITGTWSPALNNTYNATYTFTPDSGQCATNTTLDITVQIMICNSGTVANLIPNDATIKWYAAATGGTKLALTALLTTKTYYYTQTIGGYEGPRYAISVIINKPAAPTATAYQTVCISGVVSDLVATGSSILWYSSPTGGTPIDPSTPLASTNYYASQTINGCESLIRKAITVSVMPSVTPTATSPQTFCPGARVSNLVATGNSISWYTTLTGGTALPISTVLNPGTYYVSQKTGVCESLRAPVNVVINVTPVPITSSQLLCKSGIVSDLTATGTNIKWYLALTGGGAMALTTVLSTRTYYASQTVNGCESLRTPVPITIQVTPAPSASNQIFTYVATVSDLIATGSNILWYTTSTGGVALNPSTLLSSTTYYCSQTINGCKSSIRKAIIVKVPATFTGNYDATIVKIVINPTEFKVYPNPTCSILSIETSNNTTIDKVVVEDLLGKLILEEEAPVNNQINVERFSNGTYIIQVFSGEEKFLTKFIKE